MTLPTTHARRMVVILAIVIVALGASAAVAQTTTVFRDEFRSIGYGGNDGSESFSGPWRERSEADGPSAGVLRVESDDRCAGGAGNCLRIGSDGGSIDGIAIDRTADLEGADTASLAFQWRRRSQGRPEGDVRVRIGPGTGGPWTTLITIPMSGANGPQSSSFDISAYATASTTVRFEARGTSVDAYLLFDDVEFVATGSTTTTIPGTPTTTTIPGTPTTTTIPGTPTTTTIPGIPTAGESTTSSTTTTTVPDGSTTTGGAGTEPPSIPGDGSPDGAANGEGSSEVEPQATIDGEVTAAAQPASGPSSGQPDVAVVIASQVLLLGGVFAAIARAGVLPRGSRRRRRR